MLLTSYSAAALGQSVPSAANPIPPGSRDELVKVPSCEPSSIAVTFTYADKPAGAQTITVHLQNKGNSTCGLAGSLTPSFSVDGHSMLEVKSCWYCRNIDSSTAEERVPDQITLAPNERASVDLRWASTGNTCEWSDSAFLNFAWSPAMSMIFSPSNWPMHICSIVKGLGYRSEPAPDGNGDSESVRVAISPEPIYSDEYATLHVELAELPKGEPDREACADLYSVRQDSSTLARLDPLQTTPGVVVPSYTAMQRIEDRERSWPSWRKPGERNCAARGDALSADAIMKADELATITHIEWRTAPQHDRDSVFLSAAMRFSVLDVDSLTPNWGETILGIRAGLSVDRETFRMGDNIPLHVRWENVNAPIPLSQGECREPIPSLEIQDGAHNVLKTIDLVPFCSGHGWGPFEIKKGSPQRFFDELGTTRQSIRLRFGSAYVLPGPGVYYLVTVWTPRILEKIDPNSDKARWFHSAGNMAGPYGVARSRPVRIEVQP